MYSFLSDLSNVAFNDMIVVNVPLPAINGKAIGTIVPDGAFLSGLKNSIPNTISKPKIKMTIEPATANDFISTPRIFKNGFPIKKNKTINAPEISVTFHALMPHFFFHRDKHRHRTNNIDHCEQCKCKRKKFLEIELHSRWFLQM